MRKLAILAIAVFAVLAPQPAGSQGVTVRERVIYERFTTFEMPAIVRQLRGAINVPSYCDGKFLPSPYFCFVKGTEANLHPEDYVLLQPILSNGIMLCDEPRNAYSLAAWQWKGQSNGEAAYNIADDLDRLNSRWPCGYKNGLVLSDFHFSLRTSFHTRDRKPSWVLRWTGSDGYYHYTTLKADRDVLVTRTSAR